MRGHGLGRLLAASVERPLMVIQPGVATGRFCVSQEENGLGHVDQEKLFWNNRLVNCHDTVMQRRYRACEQSREAPQQGPIMDALTPTPSPAPALEIAPDSPQRFINRELSWLAFNMRVLEEASNKRHPLLERVRFLSISAGILDEFYMVRVAGLVDMLQTPSTLLSDDGMTPAHQLVAIRERASTLMAHQQEVWANLQDELREAGVAVIEPGELTETERSWLAHYFTDPLSPIPTSPPLP